MCPVTRSSFICFPSGNNDTKYVMTITENEKSALNDEGGIEQKNLNRTFELTFTDGTPVFPPSGDQSPTDQQRSLPGTQVRHCVTLYLSFYYVWVLFSLDYIITSYVPPRD